MSAAIKAVAEVANDVSKVRPPRNIFDRLGHTSDLRNSIINNEEKDYRGFNEDGVGKNYSGERNGIMPRGETILASDLGYDDESYDDLDLRDQRALDTSHEAHDFDERSEGPHFNLDKPAVTYNSSLKVASTVNVDMCRISQYADVREVHVTDHAKLIQSDIVATESEVGLTKENSNPITAVNGNEISQKTQASTGVNSTGPPIEDADSRTIYVSNVHFAVTKDSLSRHFNKLREVIKVIILTDPATGQPKGSACIEFVRKEATERALSLNGTSFLSRILKVVRKSSGQPEASAFVTSSWPRVANSRSSPYPVPRLFSRPPFGRGIPSFYRARGPIKPGARSFQWKRGAASAQTTATEIPGQVSFDVLSPPPMTHTGLTYVRTEPKPEMEILALLSLSNNFGVQSWGWSEGTIL